MLKLTTILLFLQVFCSTSSAQVLDKGFGTNGAVLMPFDINFRDGDSEILSLAQQSDGKIIVGGNAHHIESSFALVRYHETGIIDSSFHINGRVLKDFDSCNENLLRKILLQPDDKIIAIGTVSDMFAPNRYSQIGVTRFTEDGYPDSTFNGTGVLKIDVLTSVGRGATCYDAVLQNDGKIVLCGIASGKIFLIRLDDNGHFDSSFNNDGKIIIQDGEFTQFLNVERLTHLVIKPDKKIFACGYHIIPGNTIDLVLVQFNVDGTPDSTFGSNGIKIPGYGTQPGTLTGLGLQSDGKIILSGRGAFLGNSSFGPFLTRFHGDGRIDSSFNIENGGYNFTYINNWWIVATAMAIDSLDQIFLSGSVDVHNQINSPILLSYSADGDFISKYTPNVVSAPGINCALVQKNGKLLTAGHMIDGSSIHNFLMLRYLLSALRINTAEASQKVIQFYPNPATNKLYIAVKNTTSNKSIQYTIINTFGRIVQKGQLSQDIENRPIDISSLNTGTYMLCLENSGDINISKFIKIDN